MKQTGAVETAQGLGKFAAIIEDLGSVTSTCMADYNWL